MPLDDKNNDLKNDLANVKKAQKNQGYRDRLYSSSGIIIEGPEKQKEKSVEIKKEEWRIYKTLNSGIDSYIHTI